MPGKTHSQPVGLGRVGVVAAFVARKWPSRRMWRSKLVRSAEGTWSDRLEGGRPLKVIIAGGGPGGLALAKGLAQVPGAEVKWEVEMKTSIPEI